MKAAINLMLTADGSHTAVSQSFGTAYHSIHGAIQESQRVFIELGLWEAFARFPGETIRVFEMGFGTGLNALLTAREAATYQRPVQYVGLEAFPLSVADAQLLNYDQQLGTHYVQPLHAAPWNVATAISRYFSLTKQTGDLLTLDSTDQFHLIYFDAFAPATQPELWETAVFQKMADRLLPGGLLTTYCSKSYVRRNLQATGFQVEKHPGPPRKREVLRARI